ncbi:MAG TPA: hypothetical protein VIE89_13960 [Candidatus Binatia bacterium]
MSEMQIINEFRNIWTIAFLKNQGENKKSRRHALELRRFFESTPAARLQAEARLAGPPAKRANNGAVTALSVRDYHVYVPLDCTAQKDQKEVLRAFSLFTKLRL